MLKKFGNSVFFLGVALAAQADLCFSNPLIILGMDQQASPISDLISQAQKKPASIDQPRVALSSLEDLLLLTDPSLRSFLSANETLDLAFTFDPFLPLTESFENYNYSHYWNALPFSRAPSGGQTPNTLKISLYRKLTFNLDRKDHLPKQPQLHELISRLIGPQTSRSRPFLQPGAPESVTNSILIQKLRAIRLKEALEAIRAQQELSGLTVNFIGLGNIGAASLAEVVSNWSSLRHLNLKKSSIQTEGAKALSEALRNPKSAVQSLVMDGNPIGDDGLEFFAKELSHLPHLSELDLSDCDLTDAGLLILAASLSESKVSTLRLRDNRRVTPSGWMVFLSRIPSSVHMLDIRDNPNAQPPKVSTGRHLQILY